LTAAAAAAALQMAGQQGAGAEQKAKAPAGAHLAYAYSCWFPLRVQLRKELAEHYMSMGFVGELRASELLICLYRNVYLW